MLRQAPRSIAHPTRHFDRSIQDKLFLLSLKVEFVQGNLHTWVNTEKGARIESESFAHNGKYAIDPDKFFLFSSQQSSMTGGISIRTLRVEQKWSTDQVCQLQSAAFMHLSSGPLTECSSRPSQRQDSFNVQRGKTIGSKGAAQRVCGRTVAAAQLLTAAVIASPWRRSSQSLVLFGLRRQ